MSLREQRQRKGWNQEQLAAKAAIVQETVSAYETGRKNPRRMSLELAYRLADALNCEPREFLR